MTFAGRIVIFAGCAAITAAALTNESEQKNMSEQALILSADSWSMPDERTGEIRSGWSVWYVTNYRDDTINAIGFKPTKINADGLVVESLRTAKLPALFSMDYGSRPGAQGKATLTLLGVKHVADVDVFAAQPKGK